MKSVLCVHQGAELYGSDRSFVTAVSALSRTTDRSLDILLPGQGAITSLIRHEGLPKPQERHIWVLRKAGLLREITLGLPRNITALIRAMSELSRRDTVYVNTAVILDFVLASIVTRRKLILHVREIPSGLVRRVLRRLIIWSGARVIFNSKATSQAFALPASQHQRIAYNGYRTPPAFEKPIYRGDRPLRVLCIGRLNAWKGQDVLIRACAALPEHDRARLSVRMVGDVYGQQDHFRERLIAMIAEAGLEKTVQFAGLIEDPTKEYRAADVVVVPSISPEPFGRVAVEAMAHQCAVLASDHGGLREIVEDGRTGRLLAPGSPDALGAALQSYLRKPDTVAQQGAAGQVRFGQYFTQAKSDAAFLKAFSELESL